MGLGTINVLLISYAPVLTGECANDVRYVNLEATLKTLTHVIDLILLEICKLYFKLTFREVGPSPASSKTQTCSGYKHDLISRLFFFFSFVRRRSMRYAAITCVDCRPKSFLGVVVVVVVVVCSSLSRLRFLFSAAAACWGEL
jgi:hypothetical protein